MASTWRWFLAILAAVALTMGGLRWDALIHSREQGQAAKEPLLNLANPGHVLFGGGLAAIAVIALAGFTINWLVPRRRGANWLVAALPALLWLALGLAGAVTLAALAQAG